MKKTAAFLAVLLMAVLGAHAQQETPGATPENKGPYTEKPSSFNEVEVEAAKTPEDNIPHQIKGFFKDMFKSVKLGGIKRSYVNTELKINPSEIDLKDKREITVTLSILNRTSSMVKLEFPTSQRVEILLRDSTGKVIERWSEDQAFEQTAGIVTINPGERIEYVQHVPTREMKPAQKYTVEASVFNHPEYSYTSQIKTK